MINIDDNIDKYKESIIKLSLIMILSIGLILILPNENF